MKRMISLSTGLLGMGLLAIGLLPALAQEPAQAPAAAATPTGPTGKIHGHVTNPTGASQNGGTISLIGVGLASGPGLKASTTDKGSLPVDANGDYSGEVAPGTYRLIYRTPGMAADKEADHVESVKVLQGQDVVVDIDMSRKEYIDALPPEQKKQLEDLKKHNSEAMKANEVIKNLNNDLRV
ncbi:MAG: carboxypeptidase-like regulatory domain-containing protein, partial [Terracidiphilus sp.]